MLRRGHQDVFVYKTRSVGQLKRIILGHVERQDEPPMSREERSAVWGCQEVQVTDMSTGTVYVFPVKDGLALNKEPKVYKCKESKESLASVTKQLNSVKYEVIVYTGNDKGLGATRKF